MNITVKDRVGLTAEDNLNLVKSLLDNRKPQWPTGRIVFLKLNHPPYKFIKAIKENLLKVL